MKKIGPILFGCIFLLMAVWAYAVVYDRPEILSQVPEPGVLLLLGAGLILLVILGIRRRKRTAAKGKSNGG